jgi:oligopeptide/dipeptide ABC transporter ATP-binding protein
MGEMIFNGNDVMAFDDARLRDFRGRQISMIFQDPMTSLNPVQRISEHIIEAIQVHEPSAKPASALDRARVLIERLGIARRRLPDYPHQLSGGMRQRVMVGLGLVLNANLIIADEATTSLDVIVEAKLIDQFREIRDEFGVTMLVITHNIALVAELCDRLAVMYAGQIAELGSVEHVFDEPLHPYTQGLLQSVPNIRLDEKEVLYKMPGEPPNLTHPPSGCRFNPRCPYVMDICPRIDPPLKEVAPGRFVHCWLYIDHPEKTEPTVKVSQ